ncbi:MAG TPA: nucleotide sugar dehydrogenase [Anaerolineales bacterium]|nr:nucleotide sugar dehydrogenase [Anaerolineales bacterium]
MRKITVVGVGYVGLVTAAAFADLGNRVVALDIDEEKIAMLKRGEMPIYEPGLEEMVRRNVHAGRLSFTTSYAEALEGTEFAFIAVGTPEGVDGEADLRYVEAAAKSIAENMSGPLIVVNKSTVPVGTGDWVADIIRKHQRETHPFSVVSCPEFLREGAALHDFMNPHRIVLGSTDPEAAEKVAQLHLPLRAPIILTDLRTAEMMKGRYTIRVIDSLSTSYGQGLLVRCASLPRVRCVPSFSINTGVPPSWEGAAAIFYHLL